MMKATERGTSIAAPAVTRRAARTTVLATAALVGAIFLPTLLPAAGAGDTITLPGSRSFPESLTADAAGNIYFGSLATGTIYRAKAGDTSATAWIEGSTSGIKSGLGVYADDKAQVLYACSVIFGDHPDWDSKVSSLHTFNLKTGAALATYPMPNGPKSLCNDIAVAADGTAYITDTIGGQILRLKKGANSSLEKWVEDEHLKGADGIALGSDGAIYVNTFTTFKLFRVPVDKSGAAGAPVELTTSLPLDHPDGLRAIGGMKFLQAEGLGRITLVTIKGTQASMSVLTSGKPGLTSMTVAGGKVWALNAKLAYLTQPAFKDKDPGPFAAEAIGPLPH